MKVQASFTPSTYNFFQDSSQLLWSLPFPWATLMRESRSGKAWLSSRWQYYVTPRRETSVSSIDHRTRCLWRRNLTKGKQKHSPNLQADKLEQVLSWDVLVTDKVQAWWGWRMGRVEAKHLLFYVVHVLRELSRQINKVRKDTYVSHVWLLRARDLSCFGH